MLCEVRPSDFGSADPLASVELQRRWERAAFLAGGGDYRAPAQRLGDFLAGKPSESAGSVAPTYPLGVRFGTLDGCLPEFVLAALRELPAGATLPREDADKLWKDQIQLAACIASLDDDGLIEILDGGLRLPS